MTSSSLIPCLPPILNHVYKVADTIDDIEVGDAECSENNVNHAGSSKKWIPGSHYHEVFGHILYPSMVSPA